MTRPRKKWLLAEYWASLESLEVAQSALLEAGAIGIEVDDGIGPDNLRKYAPGSVRLLAYFEPSEGLIEHISASMKAFFSNCELELNNLNFKEFLEEDWQGNFVRSCTTFRVEPNIYIVPSFEIEKYQQNPQGDLFIEMDPENAFGTGQHQTTKLCLTQIYEFLQNISLADRAHMRAIDVGTGSAILAILLKKLGVSLVVGTDTDADAILTAKKNAVRNQVSLDLHVVNEEHSYPKNMYQLVVANILAPTLIHMADNLINTCTKGGILILSGILVAQAQDVILAYQRLGARLVKQDAMDDWCLLVLKKN